MAVRSSLLARLTAWVRATVPNRSYVLPVRALSWIMLDSTPPPWRSLCVWHGGREADRTRACGREIEQDRCVWCPQIFAWRHVRKRNQSLGLHPDLWLSAYMSTAFKILAHSI